MEKQILSTTKKILLDRIKHCKYFVDHVEQNITKTVVKPQQLQEYKTVLADCEQGVVIIDELNTFSQLLNEKTKKNFLKTNVYQIISKMFDFNLKSMKAYEDMKLADKYAVCNSENSILFNSKIELSNLN